MTELLDGRVEVRGDAANPTALRTESGWRRVERVVTRWVVDTDWWRRPLRREYLRCLLSGGECCEVYRDISKGDCRPMKSPTPTGGAEEWFWARRYD